MDILNSISSLASGALERAAENRVKVKVVSGKKSLNLWPLESNIVIRQNAEGVIYFDDVDGSFQITSYDWGGPVYETVSKTTETATVDSASRSKAKEKRTGRLAGAIVGGSLGAVTGGLAAPGLVAGALLGTGKKSKEKEKGRSVEKRTGQTVSYDQEKDSVAYLTLLDTDTGIPITFGFMCNAKIHGEILNMLNRQNG